MVVSSRLNVRTLDELAALSKAKPGTLSYSALAIPMQITFENWKKKSGADIVFVPSRGGSDMNAPSRDLIPAHSVRTARY